ncbi:hypothetical protein [Halalkalibacter oceani]|uniref:Peptidase M50 domain-containing protein n=1 Tax=Halalkalibacter oceani TaxID=1653776 RepID=A0A9X2IMR8_9BACI|nr:hypothetical protein [Halalkalibacter oceani]MCM3712657.1 hypothetical protein [Halalkalibacter oceani]
MFTLADIPIFLVSLLVILPLISLIHQAGHVFFVWLFGGKLQFSLGAGKRLCKIGCFEIRRIYFWHSFFQYEKLKKDTTFSHIMIFLGGSLFNIISICIVNGLIHSDVLPPHIFFYNFVYFSIYFVFFSLFPARYSDDHPSDAMAIYDLLKYGKKVDPLD